MFHKTGITQININSHFIIILNHLQYFLLKSITKEVSVKIYKKQQ